ncbi:EAL domain-containing protein [Paraliobacillus salinarum]|uniref:EAL domain-containing protein n=1 Tax=Paraliobacillus salinarum TaxID=1158996 RepID=UPI0015F51A5A|nr:EAL domain-containing protein [Paraliobacillus salinarum]
MKSALKVSIIYLIFGLAWVVSSDHILNIITDDSQSLAQLQTIKGFLFVLFTMILIYFMVRVLVKQHDDQVKRRLAKEKKLLEVINENKVFQHLFEQSSSGMLITDPKQNDNPIVYVNEGFEQITGYQREEIIGENCRFLQGEDTRNTDKIRQAIENEQPIQIELKNYRKDGTPFWNSLRINPIYDESGRLTSFIGIQEDITKKRTQEIFMENQFRMVKKIISSNDIFKTITDSCQMIEDHLDIGCIILRLDDEQKIIQCFGSTLVPDQLKSDLDGLTFNDSRKNYIDMILNDNQKIIKEMVTDDSFGFYWNLLIQADFHHFCITPIVSEDQQILGVFFGFSKEEEPLDAILLDTIRNYASILSFSLKSIEYLERIKKNERRYRLIANNSTDFILVVTKDLKVEYMSPSHKRLIGEKYDFSSIIDALVDDSKHKLLALVDQLKNGVEFDRVEVELKDLQGVTHYVDVDGKQFLDDEENQYKILLVAKDVTERKKFESSLNHVLYYDGLTQLPNRYHFKKLLDKHLNFTDNQALFVLDFDQMKEISNTFGQGADEYVLTNVVDLIKEVFPEAVIGRTGEDEFSILINDIENNRILEEALKKLLNRLDISWYYQSKEFVATVSIGATLFNKQSTEGVILEAELALKEARRKGKQQYHIYSEGMEEGAIDSFTLQNELYHALNKEEFEVWYQPQIDTKTNDVVSVEALIRWRHEELGIISPNQFIPIAEETKWIVPIGTWVLQEVCQDVVKWRHQGNSIKASINISYAQLEEPTFISIVEKILNETGCPANQIIFEITESMLMHDLSLSIRILQQIKELGIQVAVDDFGVGYSSLSYLKQFQLDYLKIDRAFITNIHEDNNDFAIVQAIMEMARTLGLEVIVEGTETKQHVELLKKLGCYYFQGYWYSKPVPKNLLFSTIDSIYSNKLAMNNI